MQDDYLEVSSNSTLSSCGIDQSFSSENFIEVDKTQSNPNSISDDIYSKQLNFKSEIKASNDEEMVKIVVEGTQQSIEKIINLAQINQKQSSNVRISEIIQYVKNGHFSHLHSFYQQQVLQFKSQSYIYDERYTEIVTKLDNLGYQFMGFWGRGGAGQVFQILKKHQDDTTHAKFLIIQTFYINGKQNQKRQWQNYRRLINLGLNINFVKIRNIENEKFVQLYEAFNPCIVMSAGQVSLSQLNEIKSKSQTYWNNEEISCVFSHLKHIIQDLSQKGVYHCDIKPKNLVLTKEGQLLLIDFGSIVFDPSQYGIYGLTKKYSYFFDCQEHSQMPQTNEEAFLFEIFSVASFIKKDFLIEPNIIPEYEYFIDELLSIYQQRKNMDNYRLLHLEVIEWMRSYKKIRFFANFIDIETIYHRNKKYIDDIAKAFQSHSFRLDKIRDKESILAEIHSAQFNFTTFQIVLNKIIQYLHLYNNNLLPFGVLMQFEILDMFLVNYEKFILSETEAFKKLQLSIDEINYLEIFQSITLLIKLFSDSENNQINLSKFLLRFMITNFSKIQPFFPSDFQVVDQVSFNQIQCLQIQGSSHLQILKDFFIIQAIKQSSFQLDIEDDVIQNVFSKGIPQTIIMKRNPNMNLLKFCLVFFLKHQMAHFINGKLILDFIEKLEFAKEFKEDREVYFIFSQLVELIPTYLQFLPNQEGIRDSDLVKIKILKYVSQLLQIFQFNNESLVLKTAILDLEESFLKSYYFQSSTNPIGEQELIEFCYSRIHLGELKFQLQLTDDAKIISLSGLQLFKEILPDSQLRLSQFLTEIAFLFDRQFNDNRTAFGFYRDALHLRKNLESTETHKLIGESMNNLALFLLKVIQLDDSEYYFSVQVKCVNKITPSKNQYDVVWQLLQDTLQYRIAHLHPNDSDIGDSYNELALFLIKYRQNNSLDSYQYLCLSHEHRKQNLLSTDRQIGQSLNNLAVFLQCNDNLNNIKQKNNDVEKIFRQTLEFRQTNLPPKDPSIGDSMQNLALFLDIKQNKNVEAQELYRMTVEFRLNEVNPNPILIAESQNVLAIFLDRQLNKLTEAEELFNKTLELRKSSLQKGHPQIAESMNNLAFFLSRGHQYKVAEAIFRETIVYRKTYLSEENPEIPQSIDNLAHFLISQKRQQSGQAEALFRQSLAMRKKFLKDTDPQLPESLINLGRYLKTIDKKEQAQKLFLESLNNRINYLSPNHPDVAKSLTELGIFMLEQQQYEKSELYLKEALLIRTENLPPNHKLIGDSLNNLAYFFKTVNKTQKALKYYQKTLEFRTSEHFAPNSPEIGVSLNNLANFFKDQKQMKQGQLYLRKTLDFRKQNLPSGDKCIGASLDNLACFLYQMNRLQQALVLFQETQNFYEKYFPKKQYIGVIKQYVQKIQSLFQAEDRLFEQIENLQNSQNTCSYEIIDCLIEQAQFYGSKSQFEDKSTQYYQFALNHAQILLKPDDNQILNCLQLVTQNLCKHKKSESEIEYLQEIIDFYQKYLPPGHRTVGNLLTQIGKIYLDDLQIFDKAQQFLEQAMKYRYQYLPNNHDTILESLDDLVYYYCQICSYDTALELQMQIFNNQCQYPTPPDLRLKTVKQIIELNKLLKLHRDNEFFLQMSLQLTKSIHGPLHSNVGQCLRNLALYYDSEQINEKSKAEKFYNKTLEFRQSNLPPDDPDIARSLEDLENFKNNRGSGWGQYGIKFGLPKKLQSLK